MPQAGDYPTHRIMKKKLLIMPASGIEILEARIAPATLDIVAGAVTYTAGGGVSNSLTLSISGANYSFNDASEPIMLTANATAAGFTGSGTNTVLGPNTAVTSIGVILGDQSDQFAVQALTDPLVMSDGAGTDSAFVTGTLNVGGALQLAAESITVNAAIGGATTAILAGNAIAIGSTVTATTRVTLQPLSATNDINLGAADAAGVLGLTDAELDRVTAPILQIGVVAGSIDIIVSAAIAPANVSTLRLISTNTITDGAAGSIVVPNLAVTSTNSVTLDNAGNDVGTLSGSVTVVGADFSFRDSDDLIIGTVDGVAGIRVDNALGATITLQAGATTQTAGANIVGNALDLFGAGPFTLNNVGNDLSTLSGTVTGAISFTEANSVTLTAPALGGLSTTNSPIWITTLAGDISVASFGGSLNAGTSTVSLTAGSAGADREIRLNAGAVVTGTGGVTFTADKMGFTGSVNAGAGIVTLQPFESGTLVNLGGADAANTLGLSDAELDLVTAGLIEVGAASAGNLTVTAAVGPAASTGLVLVSGGTIAQNAAGNLLVARVGASGATAITLGNAGNTFTNFEAETVNGLISVTHTGTLSIGGVSTALNGVQVTTSGDITITNTGSVILDGTSTEDIRAASGNVTVTALGAAADIETRNDSADGIDSNAGNVTLTSGRDILLGSATVDNFGDIEANGNLSLNAGRDIIVDENTDVQVTGAGNFSATAGRNFSILASDGTTSSSITTAVGAITIATGTGGIFTATPGGPSFLNSTAGGPITITADDMIIGATITAGTSTVTLRAATAGRQIDLGTETAGKLSLTDTELDFAIAGLLRIGDATGGAITVTAPITPAGADTLSLVSNSNILDSGTGAITIANLALAGNGVNLDSAANGIGTLAGRATGNFANAFNIVNTGTLTVGTVDGRTGVTATNGGVTLSTTGALTIATAVQGEDVPTRLTATTTQFVAGTTFTPRLNGVTPGTLHDQLAVTGAVDLAGATLAATVGFAPAPETQLVIVSNDGADAVSGTFAGLVEGALVQLDGRLFKITYAGGDGNDVALITPPALAVTVVNPKTVTFTDVDGDLVTVKTTKGTFNGGEFTGIELAASGAGQLQKLTLGAGFTGANITITAKPGANGGNGFVNVGFLDAAEVDLGAVSIAGDLGRIAAGTVADNVKVPGLKSLAAQSVGLLGTSTQEFGGSLTSQVQGVLGKLVIKGDLRASVFVVGNTDAKLGSASIGGSFIATGEERQLFAEAGIGSVKIGGDVRASGGFRAIIGSGGTLGMIAIGGALVGTSDSNVVIDASGKLAPAPASGVNLAIKGVSVRGSVEFATITAGVVGTLNSDASIGAITVGGDWIASTAQAGVGAGADTQPGTDDDLKAGGNDQPDVFSTIGSFTVKGQALGTATPANDMFGIVAERILKAKVGGRTFAFKAGTNEAFFAAPTLDGEGTENPMFDFTIRELASTTPTVALGGANLDVSNDGKTATFTDVDGDLVMVKRTVGTFNPADFNIAAAASGGGLLQQLTVSPAPGNVAVGLSITAKVSPGGGNGFVNVGKIVADQTDLGSVIIGGEMQDLDVGDSGNNRVGLGSLTVHSLGSVAGTAPTGDEINSAHGIGKITVKTDVRQFHIFANNQDSGNLGSITIGGSMVAGEIQAAANIGTIKLGGSFRGNGRIQAAERISAITIGGDFVGGTIEVFAQDAGPLKGLDFALKNFTVKGNVETTSIILGRNNNADASIGAISVGREWIASSVLAGTTAGTDTFIGTADDAKITLGGPIDLPNSLATIANILIKGQALGSTGAGDSFGIVAERIVKAQIGAVKFAFIAPITGATNRDAFAAAPTVPGASGLASDFLLREIGG